jgi:hypothetical protein
MHTIPTEGGAGFFCAVRRSSLPATDPRHLAGHCLRSQSIPIVVVPNVAFVKPNDLVGWLILTYSVEKLDVGEADFGPVLDWEGVWGSRSAWPI